MQFMTQIWLPKVIRFLEKIKQNQANVPDYVKLRLESQIVKLIYLPL
jgi:hypothetical protein